MVFLGDACHPMLPYMAQGAGSALEDGATLGILLSRVQSRKGLPAALKTYQDLRVPRSTALQKWSMKQVGSPFLLEEFAEEESSVLTDGLFQRRINHMPDGPEQEERDRLAVSQLRDQRPGYPFYWCVLLALSVRVLADF